MLTWLFNLLVGQMCWHKWKIISEIGITSEGVDRGTLYVLQCEKCGNLKQREVKPAKVWID